MAAFTILMPNFYRSEAVIIPVDSKSVGGSLGGLAAAATAMGVNVGGNEGNDANFVDVLNSRWFREQLLYSELTFKARGWSYGPERERKETLFSYLKSQNTDRGVRSIAALLTSTKDIKSKILTVSAETTSPSLSQAITHRALALLEAYAQQKGRTRGSAKAIFAEARLKEAKREMLVAEDNLRRFLEVNRNFATSADPMVRLQGMRLEAELKLGQQVVMTIALSREQALMDEKNDLAILNILDNGNLPIEKSRPARSVLVILTFAITVLTALGWHYRKLITVMLIEPEQNSD